MRSPARGCDLAAIAGKRRDTNGMGRLDVEDAATRGHHARTVVPPERAFRQYRPALAASPISRSLPRLSDGRHDGPARPADRGTDRCLHGSISRTPMTYRRPSHLFTPSPAARLWQHCPPCRRSDRAHRAEIRLAIGLRALRVLWRQDGARRKPTEPCEENEERSPTRRSPTATSTSSNSPKRASAGMRLPLCGLSAAARHVTGMVPPTPARITRPQPARPYRAIEERPEAAKSSATGSLRARKRDICGRNVRGRDRLF